MHNVALSDQLYDGSQLRSLWIAEQSGRFGSAVATFRGPCKVKEHMVDLEDIQNKAFISSDMMLHYVIEIFGVDSYKAVLYQYLFVREIASLIQPSINIFVHGDDIMVRVPQQDSTFEERKLSVSIATVSLVSGLIHIGLNILNSGIPAEVKASSLIDLGVSLDAFEISTRDAIVEAVQRVEFSTCKVRVA